MTPGCGAAAILGRALAGEAVARPHLALREQYRATPRLPGMAARGSRRFLGVAAFTAVLLGAGLVQAGEASFFRSVRQLFGAEPPPAAAVPAAPVRPPTAVRTAAAPPRPAPPAAAPVPAERAVCVRTCDGYAFPVGALRRGADPSLHQAACEAACPHAPVRLYTLAAGAERLDAARDLTGASYRRLPSAFTHRSRLVAGCTCRDLNRPATAVVDRTLRRGDLLVGEAGVGVHDGGRLRRPARTLDELAGAPLGAGERARLDRMFGLSRREASLRAFAQGLTGEATRSAAFAGRFQVAENRQVAGFAAVEAGASAFAPPLRAGDAASIRVVAPVPFGLGAR